MSGIFFIFTQKIFKKIMRKLFFFFSLISIQILFSQSFIPAYQNRVNSISQTNINTYLTEFASYGVKTTGSTNNANALAWLKAKYTSFGYLPNEIVEDPFTFGATTSKNLVVTKTGTLYPNTFVIICGHFDTIAGAGANDNGSGVSIILEIARILKNVPTEYSIKFINFSGEEQGLYGSQHYVNNIVNATTPKMDIRLVFNIDQVGGVAGQINNTIVCEKDQRPPTSNNAASAARTQELVNCTALYSNLFTTIGPAYSSDYIPFENNGEIITGFFESNESPYPHTPNDTYVNMDPVFVYNVGKAALGAMQHFAVASTTILSTNEVSENNSDSNVSIYPNPAASFFQIAFKKNVNNFAVEVLDISGKLVLKELNKNKINIGALISGTYIVQIKYDDQIISKKLIISK